MALSDLDAVLAIERVSFSQPWTADMFRAELTENPSAYFFVAVAGDDIVGYIGGWRVADELQVVSLAARPDARRSRVASRLLAHLFDHAGAPVRRASLEVRRSNHVAIAMYEQFGFRPAGVRRGYYDEPKEDAIVMEWVM
jgi:ribosomal-protein-alanine N-acetyltransferase